MILDRSTTTCFGVGLFIVIGLNKRLLILVKYIFAAFPLIGHLSLILVFHLEQIYWFFATRKQTNRLRGFVFGEDVVGWGLGVLKNVSILIGLSKRCFDLFALPLCIFLWVEWCVPRRASWVLRWFRGRYFPLNLELYISILVQITISHLLFLLILVIIKNFGWLSIISFH